MFLKYVYLGLLEYSKKSRIFVQNVPCFDSVEVDFRGLPLKLSKRQPVTANSSFQKTLTLDKLEYFKLFFS